MGSMGVSIAWFLVAGSCISIWSNVAKLVFTMLWYYARHGLPVNEDGKKVVFVGRGVQNLWSQLIACTMFTLLSANARVLLVDGPGRDVRFFLPFFITITWSFGDFANHLLVVRVTRINFPASYRHRCYLWLISLNAALYLKNFDNGMYYEEALNLAWI